MVNTAEMPTEVTVSIENLTYAPFNNATTLTLWRVFTAAYAVNATTSTQTDRQTERAMKRRGRRVRGISSGAWLLRDWIGARDANVYRVGCEVLDPCVDPVTHKPLCLVENGNFELVDATAPGQLLPQGSGWYCLQQNTTDDRCRVNADAGDPYEGRYSLVLLVPTAQAQWLAVPSNTKSPGPLSNGTTYNLTFAARSSPAGFRLSLHTGAVPVTPAATNTTAVVGTLSTEWQVYSYTFRLPLTSPTPPAPGSGGGGGGRAFGAIKVQPGGPFFHLQPPHKPFGGKVWLDSVAISPTAQQP